MLDGKCSKFLVLVYFWVLPKAIVRPHLSLGA
jgi:hypothetical protein